MGTPADVTRARISSREVRGDRRPPIGGRVRGNKLCVPGSALTSSRSASSSCSSSATAAACCSAGRERAQRVLCPSPVADAEDLVGVDAVLGGPGRPRPRDRGGGVHQRSVDVEQDGVEQDGVEQDGVEQDGVEQDGVEQDGVEQDGVEQDGVDAKTHGSHATGAARPGTLLSDACWGPRARRVSRPPEAGGRTRSGCPCARCLEGAGPAGGVPGRSWTGRRELGR